MKLKAKEICQTRAAAMAATTHGRKTDFKSAKTLKGAAIDTEMAEEIAEALAKFRR
jgi:hypothetical protein